MGPRHSIPSRLAMFRVRAARHRQWKGHDFSKACPHHFSPDLSSSASTLASPRLLPAEEPESRVVTSGLPMARAKEKSLFCCSASAETAQAPKNIVSNTVTTTTTRNVIGMPFILNSSADLRLDASFV